MTSDDKKIQKHIPREAFARVIQESLNHETRADELEKLGSNELASKEYEESILMEEKCLGKDHPVIKEFHEKLHQPTGSWKHSAHRHGAQALKASLEHEKAGDFLVKAGDKEHAKMEYNSALAIEEHVLGKNHPMTASLKEKVIITME